MSTPAPRRPIGSIPSPPVSLRAFPRPAVWALLGACAMALSCKATVEGENKAWTQNSAHAQELIVLYPGFAGAIKEQVKLAEDAMASAKSSAGDDAAKKMASANAMLSGGFVASLGGVDAKMKRLRERMIVASSTAEHAGDQGGAQSAAADAQRILGNVDGQLKAGASDAASAAIVLRKIESDLASASSNVEHVIDAANARKVSAGRVDGGIGGGAAGASGTAGAAVPVAKANWKCSYCNHLNEDSAMKCKSCGAPRPTAK